MAMPSGDTPEQGRSEYYHYLQATRRRRSRRRRGTSTGRRWPGSGASCRRSSSSCCSGSASTGRRGSARHLPGRQLGRLHDGARRAGDAVLPAPHRRSSSRSPSRSSSATSSGGRSSDGRRCAARSSSTRVHRDARVPADLAAVYASLQALKGHVQEYPGCQASTSFVARRGRRRRARPLLHDVGHGRPARGVPRARLHLRAAARRHRRGASSPSGASSWRRSSDVEQRQTTQPRPARPLFGYRDIGAPARGTRRRR